MKTLVMLAVCALALPGCTIAKIQGSGSKPLVLNQIETNATVRKFEASKFKAFDWTQSFNVDDVLREDDVDIDAPDVRAIQNVRIEVKVNVWNWLLDQVTLGLAQSRTMVIKGDLIVDPSGE